MKKIESTSYVLNVENIDTDQIIPAAFLKATSREGFGKNLFYNWRYHEDGSEKQDFAFNRFTQGSEVLIAGNNFGCGSSREHAAWAIEDFGIKAIISSQFADIFKANALNNGILPIEVSSDDLAELINHFEKDIDTKIHIDLVEQQFSVQSSVLSMERDFQIDPFKKELLIRELKEIEYLIEHKTEIEAFEKSLV